MSNNYLDQVHRSLEMAMIRDEITEEEARQAWFAVLEEEQEPLQQDE